jgi:hypothetical protein
MRGLVKDAGEYSASYWDISVFAGTWWRHVRYKAESLTAMRVRATRSF